MIEKVLLDYLNASELSVKAYAQRPENEPKSYVLIDKTGSERTNKIEAATIAIQSYAPTLFEAASLNEEVKAIMDEFVEEPSVGRVRLATDYNFTSTTAKRYRYQAVYNITHY
jgi:hypothetical protein